jgi:ribosomal protein L34E
MECENCHGDHVGTCPHNHCDSCHLWQRAPQWARLETNEWLYGRPLAGSYCARCVRDFVTNEIADGVRNPDGSFKS